MLFKSLGCSFEHFYKKNISHECRIALGYHPPLGFHAYFFLFLIIKTHHKDKLYLKALDVLWDSFIKNFFLQIQGSLWDTLLPPQKKINIYFFFQFFTHHKKKGTNTHALYQQGQGKFSLYNQQLLFRTSLYKKISHKYRQIFRTLL